MLNLDKELKRISDWLVIGICHERYSFGTNVNLYDNRSLEWVLKDLRISKDEIEKYLEKPREKYFPDEYNYNYDRCIRNPLDVKYSFPYLKGLPLLDIHLETTHIIDMNYLREEKYVDFIWGSTDKKFGLIDINRESLDNQKEGRK